MRTSKYWQLLLLSVSPFGKTSDKFAPIENPGHTGSSYLRQEGHGAPRSQKRQDKHRDWPCSDETSDPLWPGLCPTPSQLIIAPQGALQVEQEKDLSAYNWNSFNLHCGKHQTNRGKAQMPA
uniref:Uncharacterized protein n=1 Tax=Monodelphis domestica TaxID=13616 RepID=A0A5F8G925_MONDO